MEKYYVGKVAPYSPEQLEASKSKLAAMDKADKERILLEEAKNKVESYIYYIKNKLLDDEDSIAKVSTKNQREECSKASAAAEEWLDDEGYKADLKTMVAKYEELSAPFEKIMLRVKETVARPEAISDRKSVV